jgi:hypothetical protein
LFKTSSNKILLMVTHKLLGTHKEVVWVALLQVLLLLPSLVAVLEPTFPCFSLSNFTVAATSARI